mgnify:CR=1 FL=1
MQNKQKYIYFIVIILVIILGAFLLWKGEKANAPADTVNVKIPDNTTTVPAVNDNGGNSSVNTPVGLTNLTKEQKDLLAKLQKSVDVRDFETFADLLQEVYKNQWNNEEFTKLESNMYVYATDTYWVKGDLANSLRVSTVVYNKVSEAWRFRYLRILTLEKYGRNAFNGGDLQIAENYANQILQMMFRPEGANLLADIYISKINTNIKDGNTTLAKQNLGFIWDYEVSADRRTTLTNLKTQLGM